MAKPVTSAASQPILLSNLSSPSRGSSAGSPLGSSQQSSSRSPSNISQQSSNAGTPSSPSQHPLRPAPSPSTPRQSSNLGVSGSHNPQLLSPASNFSANTTSNTSAGSSTISTINIPKPTSPSIPTTSLNVTPSSSATSAYPAVPRYAFIKNTLHAWGMGSLYEAGVKMTGRLTKQRRRMFQRREHITLFHHRGIALWASLLHLLPIAATATITYYMNTEYFVGNQLAGNMGTDKFKLLGLQFAAKVHELLMMSTLTNVIFALVRHELSRGDGVPFAFLSAGFGVPKVSFLWSKDFIALCKGKYDTLYKKMLFLLAILVCIFLCLAVGPVSATALTPVRRDWEAGGTKIWLSSPREELFPEILDGEGFPTHCINGTGPPTDVRCPSEGWKIISNGYLPQVNLESRSKSEIGLRVDANTIFGVERDDLREYILVSNALGLQFNIVTLFGHPKESQKTRRSAVMAPHTAVSNALVLNEKLWVAAAQEDMTIGSKRHRFTERADSSYMTTRVPLAAASTVCKMLYAPSRYNRPPGPRPWGPDLWDDAASKYINTTEFLRWETSVNHYDYPRDSGPMWEASPQLFWLEVPPNAINGTSIIAFISLELDDDFTVFGCNVDARWVYDKLISNSARALPKPFNNKWYQEMEWESQNYTQVNIRQSFANLTSVNNTAFEEMMVSVGVNNRDTDPAEAWAFRLETVLNLMIVNGMARTAPETQQHGTIHGFEGPLYVNGTTVNYYNSSRWWEHFMPNGAFGPGGDPYDLTVWPDKNNSFGFQMDMFAEGYGYSFRRSTASRVSISILLLQLAIASCFIIYTISTGTSSSSWESPAELLALAFASEAPQQPADRKGLATGESSIESLKKLYCVEVDGNRLQLKEWTGPHRVEFAKRLKPNTVYD